MKLIAFIKFSLTSVVSSRVISLPISNTPILGLPADFTWTPSTIITIPTESPSPSARSPTGAELSIRSRSGQKISPRLMPSYIPDDIKEGSVYAFTMRNDNCYGSGTRMCYDDLVIFAHQFCITHDMIKIKPGKAIRSSVHFGAHSGLSIEFAFGISNDGSACTMHWEDCRAFLVDMLGVCSYKRGSVFMSRGGSFADGYWSNHASMRARFWGKVDPNVNGR